MSIQKLQLHDNKHVGIGMSVNIEHNCQFLILTLSNLIDSLKPLCTLMVKCLSYLYPFSICLIYHSLHLAHFEINFSRYFNVLIKLYSKILMDNKH